MEKVQPVSRMISTMSSAELARDRRVATKSGSKSAREMWEFSARGRASETRRREKSEKTEGGEGTWTFDGMSSWTEGY